MNKKIIIIFSILILTVVIFMIFGFRKKGNLDGVSENETLEKPTTQYDENTGYYYVKDSKTGEIRGASKDEAELKIYIDNPDYDPDPFSSNPTDLEEFINMSQESNQM